MHGGRVTPERRLLIAILADAVDCYQKNLGARSARGRRLCRDAEQWMLSDDQAWVFSFRNICDALGVDAEAMRARARAWKRHHASTLRRVPEPSRLNLQSRRVRLGPAAGVSSMARSPPALRRPPADVLGRCRVPSPTGC